jgi:exopolysaccharide biosynthesis predicted pyruvyltransferase EpsI
MTSKNISNCSNNMKYIVCIPQGGLNDMLCQCLKSIQYAVKTNRICYIVTSHTAYKENLGNYFESILPNVHFVDRSSLHHLNSLSCFPLCLKGKLLTYETYEKDHYWFEKETNTPLLFSFMDIMEHDIIVHEAAVGGSSIDIFQYLRLKEHVKSEYKKRQQILPANYVAVHIRHTDYQCDNLDMFFKLLKYDIENTPYFLASDNSKIIEACLKKYPKGICASKPLSLKENDVNLHLSTSEWATEAEIKQRNLDAILDLLCLANSNQIVSSFPYSGYTRLANDLSRNKSFLHILLKSTADLYEEKTNISYDSIQPFKVKEDKYLFFDIFRTNKNTILCICPRYTKDVGYFKQIRVFYDGLELKKLPTTFQALHWHIQDSSARFEVEFPYDVECAEIIVSFENEHRMFYLYAPPKQNKRFKFIHSTLFKYDKHLFPIFYNYYKQLGIEKHYLYYNGKLTESLQNFFNEYPNVQLIEWNYLYTHKVFEADVWHHAQPCQVTHIIYKYAKPYSDYVLLNDFDEYIDMGGVVLQDLLSRNTFDIIIFENYWADLGKVVYYPTEIPKSFYRALSDSFPHQSKCIFKSESIEMLSMHQPFTYTIENPNICPIYFKLFHFWRWSGKNRTIKTSIPYTITNYHEIDVADFLQKFKSENIIYIPNPGNNGDSLIAKGALEMLKSAKTPYEIGKHTDFYSEKTIIYAGGGNLVGIYKECENFLENNLKLENKIIILPHTIRNIDHLFKKFHKNVFLICRERVSYNYCKERTQYKENVLLSHDLAFQISNLDMYKQKLCNGILNAFRLDCEKTSIVIPTNNLDISNMNTKYNNTSDLKVIDETCHFMFNTIANHKIINTNRLHVAIAGALLGRQVNLYSNSYSKNKDIYEYSLKDKYPNVKFIQ